MSDLLISTPVEVEVLSAPTADIQPVRRFGWFEPFLVCLVAFGQSMIASIYMLTHRAAIPGLVPDTNLRWIGGALNEATALVLLWYVLRRSQRNFRAIGFRPSIRGMGVGVALAFGAYVAYAIASLIIGGAYFWWFGARARPGFLARMFLVELFPRQVCSTFS